MQTLIALILATDLAHESSCANQLRRNGIESLKTTVEVIEKVYLTSYIMLPLYTASFIFFNEKFFGVYLLSFSLEIQNFQCRKIKFLQGFIASASYIPKE